MTQSGTDLVELFEDGGRVDDRRLAHVVWYGEGYLGFLDIQALLERVFGAF